jgi:hypothetical protein
LPLGRVNENAILLLAQNDGLGETLISNVMDNQYGGMTVNERLWASNLSDEFYKAVEEQDVYKAVLILKKVELTDINIWPILEKHFNNIPSVLKKFI